mmetsp:Transcript_115605/g.331946  ORF Transcript_115605/g.331946 Transcript_115605/m.331946 type:complete len:150 (+) Transcript_115605:248-697(+)
MHGLQVPAAWSSFAAGWMLMRGEASSGVGGGVVCSEPESVCAPGGGERGGEVDGVVEDQMPGGPPATGDGCLKQPVAPRGGVRSWNGEAHNPCDPGGFATATEAKGGERPGGNPGSGLVAASKVDAGVAPMNAWRSIPSWPAHGEPTSP